MTEKSRPRQKEYAGEVRDIHKKAFKLLFCRICPLNKIGFDKNINEIPLEAHHAKVPYRIDKNQDATGGILVCRLGHRKLHMQDGFGGLTRAGKILQEKFTQNDKKDMYDVSINCDYK